MITLKNCMGKDVLKKKILYPVKISFKSEIKLKTFPDIQKLKDHINNRNCKLI